MPSIAADKIVDIDYSSLRRFELPDIDRHGVWLFPRLRTAYKHLNDRQLIGWLRAICYSPEYQFNFQEHSVALFQIMAAHTLSPQPIIYERFVFAADKDNPEHVAQASMFYPEAAKWGRHQGAGALIVEQISDVPHELIRDRLGRVLERKEMFFPL